MIKGFVRGQTLKLAHSHIVADTIDYLIAKFSFQGEDWRGLDKWMHLKQGEQTYVVRLIDDKTRKEDHLNLGAGVWSVWLHGAEQVDGQVVLRITTNVCDFKVEESGALDGEALPELPIGVSEQLAARVEALESQSPHAGALPSVNEENEGQVLTVVNGAWSAAQLLSGGGDVVVDTELSATSRHPVQNKVIAQELAAMRQEMDANVEALSQRVAPEVTTAQNGKVLTVVDGAWAAADVPVGGVDIVVDTELSATSEHPVQNKVIYRELNDLAERIENSSGSSNTIPTFNLAALGLPTVSPGENFQVSTDTSELMAALDRGPVKFLLGMNLASGENLSVSVVMNGAYCYYLYTAVALLLVGGSFIRLVVQVLSGKILVSFQNFSDLISAS